MDKEELLFLNRVKELAYQTFNKGYATYTDFLNMNELSLFYTIVKDLPAVQYVVWGGYETAERCVLCFYQDYEVKKEELDLTVLKIEPVNAKFSNTLTHRDFLGAILNLGIERAKVGDILIKDNIGYVFTNSIMGDYISQSLTKIKHTNVCCSLSAAEEIEIMPSYLEVSGTISSNRLDSIVALAFKTSRSSITGLIAGGKVFVNGKIVEFNSYQVKEEDIISVRGMGKFIYKGIKSTTKKGRFYATILKYN